VRPKNIGSHNNERRFGDLPTAGNELCVIPLDAFGMDREFLPDELAPPANLAELLEIAEWTAADPTWIADIKWSPELMASWRERLSRFVQALRPVVNGLAGLGAGAPRPVSKG
jgi:hypothetical protein